MLHTSVKEDWAVADLEVHHSIWLMKPNSSALEVTDGSDTVERVLQIIAISMPFRLDVVEQTDRAKVQVFEKQFGTGRQQSGRVFKDFAIASYPNHRAVTVSARCEGTLILHKATGSGRHLAWQKT